METSLMRKIYLAVLFSFAMSVGTFHLNAQEVTLTTDPELSKVVAGGTVQLDIRLTTDQDLNQGQVGFTISNKDILTVTEDGIEFIIPDSAPGNTETVQFTGPSDVGEVVGLVDPGFNTVFPAEFDEAFVRITFEVADDATEGDSSTVNLNTDVEEGIAPRLTSNNKYVQPTEHGSTTIQVVDAFPVDISLNEDSEGNDITDEVLDAPDIQDTASEITSLNTDPSNGSANLTDDGTLTYTPDNNFAGDDSFQVSVDDPSDIPVQVNVKVEGVNDPPTDITLTQDEPVAENDSGATIGSLSASDVDKQFEGDSHTFSITDDPSGNLTISDSTLNINDGQALNYEADYITDDGQLPVEIKATDAAGAEVTKTVNVDVQDVNEKPVYTQPEQLDSVISLGAIQGNYNVTTDFRISGVTDEDGDELTYTPQNPELTVETVSGEVSGENTVSLQMDSDGQCTFDAGDSKVEPGADNYVEYSFNFDVTEANTGDQYSLEGLTYTIKMISDEPPEIDFQDTPASVQEHDTININVTVDDTDDAEGTPDDIEDLTITVDGEDKTSEASIATSDATGTLSYSIPTDQNTSTHHDSDKIFNVAISVTDAAGASATEVRDITVVDVNTQPRITESDIIPNEGASLSKPNDPENPLNYLEATGTVSDADAEDFPDGLPADDDSITFVWEVARKDYDGGNGEGELFKVKEGTVTEESGTADFLDESDLPDNFYATEEQNEIGFRKGDKVEVTATLDDGSGQDNATASVTESITIGNPPWYPAISWEGDVDEYYRVSISNEDMDIVKIHVSPEEETKVRPVDYFNADWNSEYIAVNTLGITGLRPGEFNVQIGVYDDENEQFEEIDSALYEQSLEVSEYDAPSVGTVPEAISPAGNEGLAEFTFNKVASAAGYKLSIDGPVNEEQTVLFQPDEDDAVPTSKDVSVKRPFRKAGTYTVELTPVNPDAKGEKSTSSLELENGFTVGEDKKPDFDSDWSLTPGGSASRGQPKYVGTVGGDSSKLSITLEWNDIGWADKYFLYIANVATDEAVEGYNRPLIEGTSKTVELTPGNYYWHVISQNDNGFTNWSPPAWVQVKGKDYEASPEKPGIDIKNLEFDFDNQSIDVIVANAENNPTKAYAFVYNVNDDLKVLDDLPDNARPLESDTLSLALGQLKENTEYSVQLKPVNDSDDEGDWTDPKISSSGKPGVDKPTLDFDKEDIIRNEANVEVAVNTEAGDPNTEVSYIVRLFEGVDVMYSDQGSIQPGATITLTDSPFDGDLAGKVLYVSLQAEKDGAISEQIVHMKLLDK